MIRQHLDSEEKKPNQTFYIRRLIMTHEQQLQFKKYTIKLVHRFIRRFVYTFVCACSLRNLSRILQASVLRSPSLYTDLSHFRCDFFFRAAVAVSNPPPQHCANKTAEIEANRR